MALRRMVVLGGLVLTLCGCKSALEVGDRAYMQQDWAKAAVSYERALRDADDPATVQVVRARLDESRVRAAAEQVDRSRHREASGDLDGAFVEAEKAVAFGQSHEAAARLAELRPRVAQAKLEAARAALAAGRVDEGVAFLRASVHASPTAEAQSMLATAQTESERQHQEAAARACAAGDDAMRRDQWVSAAQSFADANRHAPGVRAKEEEFCNAMAEGERAGASGQTARSEVAFQRALSTGVRPDAVKQRIHQFVPARYAITLHGAAILPFKPGSFRRWDGVSSGAVPGAGQMLVQIAGMSGPQGFAMAKFTQLVADQTLRAMDPPDCFVTVIFEQQQLGGIATKNQDDLTPVWNVGFEVVATPGDGRIVQFAVLDADVMDHDNVGSWQTTIGELVAIEGARTISLVGTDGSLPAGGIVALAVSVERK